MWRPASRTSARAVFGGLALALLVFVYYVGLVTQFSYELWPTTSGGFVFNSQSRALLDGRLDIDPKVIGNEGFERDGRTYTYFGLWPALLRLPLANQLWRDWTSLSCALAATLAALALISAAAATAAPAERPLTRAIALTLAASFVLSGPQVELLGKPSVYVEAVLWAYAAACVFLCAALPLLYGRTATTARLTVLAACAAVALLARVSTGLALYVAFAAFVCVLAWRAIQTAGAWRTLLRRLLPGLALLAAAVLVTAVVNTQRWGRPFEFAPLTLNKYYAADPVRLERLARHGAFSLARLPDALSYYAAPGWFFAAPAGSARAVRVDDLFDGPEGPPIGIPQAQGLWLALAVLGAWACISGRAGIALRPGVAALALGLAIGPLLIASYHYLAFRYRTEFAPPILLFALLGLHQLRARLAQRGAALQGLLLALTLVACAAQVAQAHAARRAYTCTPMGSYQAARSAALHCLALPRVKHSTRD